MITIREILPQFAMIQPNQGWIGARKFIIIPRFRSKEWPKFFVVLGDQTRSLALHFFDSEQSDYSALHSSSITSAPWESVYLVGSPWGGCHSSWLGVQPSLSRVVSIQTTAGYLVKMYFNGPWSFSRIVEELHRRNVVHRDLKLGNIVLNLRSRKVTLTNFCLGKHLMNERDLLKVSVLDGRWFTSQQGLGQ